MSLDIAFRDKNIKFTVVLFVLTVVLTVITYTAWRKTVPSKICGACHMMKPEYYTWQVSTHSRVNCVSCHIDPGPVSFLKFNQSGIKHLYSAAIGDYVSPIRKLKPVADGACERCHEINGLPGSTKKVLVPHDIHKSKRVNCTKCHRGIVHFNISERRVTFAGDYNQWDSAMALSMADQPEFSQVSMETCIRCHRLRKAPLGCTGCHSEDRRPAIHRDKDFLSVKHGSLANNDIRNCDTCHRFMSEQQADNLSEPEKFLEYLDRGQKQQGVSAVSYARINDFCRDCHARRPPSHKDDYIQKHGKSAQKDNKKCAVCHNNQVIKGPQGAAQPDASAVARTACSSCHPSIHSKSVQWQNGYHPVELPAKPRINKSCYTCHQEKSCGRCHGMLKL